MMMGILRIFSNPWSLIGESSVCVCALGVGAVEANAGISLTHFGQNSLNKDRAWVESVLATLRRLGLPE